MNLLKRKRVPVKLEMGKSVFTLNDYLSRKSFEEDCKRIIKQGLNARVYYSDGTTSEEVKKLNKD